MAAVTWLEPEGTDNATYLLQMLRLQVRVKAKVMPCQIAD